MTTKLIEEREKALRAAERLQAIRTIAANARSVEDVKLLLTALGLNDIEEIRAARALTESTV
jgi:hypothetical protein